MVPSPLTGGGGNMAMKASWMPAYFLFRSAAIALPLSDGSLRSSNGFSVENTMPAFEELVKPEIDRPGNATELSTPGWVRAMSLILRMTSSVRSSVAPSGSRAEADQILLVLARHEAAWHLLEQDGGDADQHDIEADHDATLPEDHLGHAAAVVIRRTRESRD